MKRLDMLKVLISNFSHLDRSTFRLHLFACLKESDFIWFFSYSRLEGKLIFEKKYDWILCVYFIMLVIYKGLNWKAPFYLQIFRNFISHARESTSLEKFLSMFETLPTLHWRYWINADINATLRLMQHIFRGNFL